MNAGEDFTPYALNNIRRLRLKRGAALRSLELNSEALCYVAKGEGQLHINGTAHQMKAGNCCLLHKGSRIAAYVGADHTVIFTLCSLIAAAPTTIPPTSFRKSGCARS